MEKDFTKEWIAFIITGIDGPATQFIATLARSQFTRPHQQPLAMPTHEWKETTEDGQRRILRASRHSGVWKLQSRMKGDECWTTHEPASLADLRSLRDVLWRKYQRGRLAHKDILLIDGMIEDREKAEGEEDR